MTDAILLLSGGLDSATTLALAKHDGFRVHCLCVAYGQRHAGEARAAREVATRLGAASFRRIEIDLRVFGGSALTSDTPVPRNRDAEEIGDGIPVTYVPARNTLFLSYALAAADAQGFRDIFIGVNAVDYSGYPDCRPEFIAAFERMANLATRVGVEGAGIRVHTPLLHLTKAEIIRRGLELGVDYSLTRSCYDPAPDDAACGECDACILRRAGFAALGREDPIRYAS